MKYEDLIQYGNEQNVKQEGKYYQKGKEHIIEDGDIIFFRFNVGKGKAWLESIELYNSKL